MKVKIERGVPVPSRKISSALYPLDSLKNGESFIAGEYTRERQQQVANAIYNYKEGHPDKNFTQRKTTDGLIRVWRTA